MSALWSNVLAFVLGTIAVVFGQFVASLMSARAARQEREAARQGHAEKEARERFAALSSLSSELRLNSSLARSSEHLLIAGAWIPFQLDAFASAKQHLATVPQSVSKQVLEAISIPREYLAFEQIQRPTDPGTWNQYRMSRAGTAADPLVSAADALDAYLKRQMQFEEEHS